MTSEVTQELLPCPFCGGKAERFTLPEDSFGNGGGDVITCSRCQASSHVEFGRKENLVDRWNTRLTAQSGEGRSGAGEEPGPFHVSQSGDGKKLWFSARDPASGVTIPARDRTDARNLVSSLNHACATFATLNARQSGEGEREALREALSDLWSIVHGCDLRLSVPMETIAKVRAALRATDDAGWA